MKKNFYLHIVSLFLLFSTSCSGDDTNNVSPVLEGMSPENFPVLDGSDSTEPLRDILMCRIFGFQYKWERYSPFLQDPTRAKQEVRPVYACSDSQRALIEKKMQKSNTHQSYMNLIDGKVELVIAARAASRDENKYARDNNVALIEKPIAKDALTFMVNNSNPIECLSVEQIRKIYTGDITNWQEVGGEDMLITPYVRNRNSGSQEKFETMVMDGLEIKKFPEWHMGTAMETPYFQIENDRSGIAFTPYYYYSVIVGYGSTKAIGIEGVSMIKENIYNDTYPYVTNIYASIRADIDKSSTAYKIFEFLTSDKGQSVVEESGYIPLHKSSTGISKQTNDGKIEVSYLHGNIAVKCDECLQKIQVFDLNGTKVFSKSVNDKFIKIHHHLSGVFVISLFFDNGSSYIKNLKSATYRVSWEFTCKTTKILLLYIFLGHNRNVVNTKFPYPIKRLEVIRRFNQKSMAFNQSLS